MHGSVRGHDSGDNVDLCSALHRAMSADKKRKGGEVRPCNDSEAVDEHIAGHDTIPESVLLRRVVFLHSPDEEEGCTSAIFW